jgi:hypothetical protein
VCGSSSARSVLRSLLTYSARLRLAARQVFAGARASLGFASLRGRFAALRRGLAGSGLARLPLAGVVAMAVLVAADRGLLGPDGPWERFVVEDPNSAAPARLALRELRAAEAGRPRVAAVGTSMVIDGFDAALAARRLPGVHFAKLGHPRFEPFVLLQLVPELVAARADAVVLILSELDTHRPLRLEPVPGSSGASLAAIADLLRVTGPRFALENRVTLYRLAASSASNAYRYRVDLERLAPGPLRAFARDPRFGETPKPDPFRPVAIWDGRHNAVPIPAQRHTFDLFPPRMDQFNARLQAGTVQEITPGRHAAVQQALLRRTVEKLRRAGVEVVIVQGVMHPAAQDYYDPVRREEFAAFAAGLERDLGARFVPVAAMEPFAESDFYDLIHVNRQGAAKMTRGILAGLARAGIAAPVTPPPGSPAPPPRAR